MDYDCLHEAEVVTLRAQAPSHLSDLLPVFTSQGFTIHDDIVSLDRTDSFPPWQAPSVVEVECQFQGEEVFGFASGKWDLVLLTYHFALLPFEKSAQFIGVVTETSRRLGIVPELNGKVVTPASLGHEFGSMRDELRSETGEEPGSEHVAILIQSMYPRF